MSLLKIFPNILSSYRWLYRRLNQTIRTATAIFKTIASQTPQPTPREQRMAGSIPYPSLPRPREDCIGLVRDYLDISTLGHMIANVAIKATSQGDAASVLTNNLLQVQEGIWSLMPVRTKIRVYFPRPNERRRIKRHGWYARMSTPAGRKILMNRILKGKRILSH